MPAAAVIPALKMHRIIAAVKKLVVGSVLAARSVHWACTGAAGFPAWFLPGVGLHRSASVAGRVYFEQIRVLQTGVSLECSCME